MFGNGTTSRHRFGKSACTVYPTYSYSICPRQIFYNLTFDEIGFCLKRFTIDIQLERNMHSRLSFADHRHTLIQKTLSVVSADWRLEDEVKYQTAASMSG